MGKKKRAAVNYGVHASGRVKRPPKHYVGFHRPEVVRSRKEIALLGVAL